MTVNAEVIIKPKTPNSPRWWFFDHYRVLGYPGQRWMSKDGHVAVTAVEVVDDNHNENIGPEYHVSISKNGGRVSADEIPELLREFDLEGADEDNHVKDGIARHFWKPVADKYTGFICPCKDTEHAITEGDYVWRPLAIG